MIKFKLSYCSLVALLSGVAMARNCGFEDSFQGCRLVSTLSSSSLLESTETSECFCGISCGKNDFPFPNRAVCEAAIDDPCYHSPCRNGGECIELLELREKKGGRFRCECGGTGFYGDKCQKNCPERRMERDNVFIREITFEIRRQEEEEIPLACL